jgi:hypothetical protein
MNNSIELNVARARVPCGTPAPLAPRARSDMQLPGRRRVMAHSIRHALNVAAKAQTEA